MAVTRPRNRLVYFRLSEEDFQKLSRMCDGAEGARSISEVARSAVSRMLAAHSPEKTCSVDAKIEVLQEQIRMLTDLLCASQCTRRSGESNGRPGVETDEVALDTDRH